MVKYGYARVSSRGQAVDGNSLAAQEEKLKQAGADVVYKDVYTGAKMNRPELQKILDRIQPGDTLIICKLDRLCRTAQEGVKLITELVEQGIIVNILNMGVANLTPMGKLMLNIMAAFAEFEREIIVERLAEGKDVAKQKKNYREGRKRKFSKKKLDSAMELLETHSYSQVEEITGISKATLCREKARRKVV